MDSELLAAAIRYRQRAKISTFKHLINLIFFVIIVEVFVYDILKCGMWVIEKLNAIKPIIEPVPLLADGIAISKVGTTYDRTIWHNSIPDYIHATTDHVVEGRGSTSEISLNQNSVFKRSKYSSTKHGTNSIDIIHKTSSQIGVGQITPTQIDTFQISIPDNRTIQPGFYQRSTKKIGSTQIGSPQISETQIGSTQVDIPQDSTFEVNIVAPTFAFSNYHSPSEVSLTGSVPFQQLFSGNFPNHDLTSNFFSNFKYSATNLWSTLFDPTFNLTLQISDLPTGQLAEAQITNYKTLGRPNGGTILIDADAKGEFNPHSALRDVVSIFSRIILNKGECVTY